MIELIINDEHLDSSVVEAAIEQYKHLNGLKEPFTDVMYQSAKDALIDSVLLRQEAQNIQWQPTQQAIDDYYQKVISAYGGEKPFFDLIGFSTLQAENSPSSILDLNKKLHLIFSQQNNPLATAEMSDEDKKHVLQHIELKLKTEQIIENLFSEIISPEDEHLQMFHQDNRDDYIYLEKLSVVELKRLIDGNTDNSHQQALAFIGERVKELSTFLAQNYLSAQQSKNYLIQFSAKHSNVWLSLSGSEATNPVRSYVFPKNNHPMVLEKAFPSFQNKSHGTLKIGDTSKALMQVLPASEKASETPQNYYLTLIVIENSEVLDPPFNAIRHLLYDDLIKELRSLKLSSFNHRLREKSKIQEILL